jgi:hypothetical protein
LAAIKKLKFGLVIAVLLGAATLAGAGPAMAAAKMSKSDTVSFKGTINATGEFLSSSCKLKSDLEATVACQAFGAVRPISETMIEVESAWVSEDGEGVFRPMIATRSAKSKPPKELYEGTGPCHEREVSDLPGNKETIVYPCMVAVKLTIDQAKKTISGKYTVTEEATAP